MSRLVEGEWVADADLETDDEGEFQRQEQAFRDRIGPDGDFPVEAGRYHIYISRACPWAHRVAMTRALKGLDDAISLSIVQPERYGEGWEFSDAHPDPLYGADYLRELYVRADPDVTGRPTVPVLWDRETERIVNNESEEIMRMLDVAGHELATRDVDLYPEGYRDEVDRLIDDIYEPINNGVYRAGFAESQGAYDRAVDDLFDALDHYDDLLADQRYLAGDRLTEADLAMFATLVRFDHVYHTHFKCNRRAIHEYDNLWEYTKDLYTTPGIERTVNMDHIVRHYYVSHADLNPKRLVPTGPDIDFTEGHDRDRLPGGPPEALQ
ncbi:glutathione S-transferase family protein [Haloplanus aerogenes]|uniref:Glutathione S-transferase family protein n=1 Tax=Haloplanus aerogenes TaxID=660522 RepID=A0A3M0DQ38_9EURY|nr:glutathione S-transferase family protein [Haloplanus aerogenes]AZH24658.1 glutathione S-transferase family protein [Haloplanus aerogenes]RMB23685.1 putative glutathione S-transferase [Haloplanus aerogenes]